MGVFSRWSVITTLVAIIFYVGATFTTRFVEMFLASSLIIYLISFAFSFFAVHKSEKGKVKLLSFISFFIIGAYVVLMKPFEVVRLLLWAKNLLNIMFITR
ncbi:hypothetical protein [Bacillus kexueae]|uniref:hypothetical protein n=1 Tax=Aeribacillus kexueae TaxID=2078952 RepID=UPI001FAE86AD|nr:hypothetical protein [Bacillus kexueae]